MTTNLSNKKGFTLVEMIVSLGLFTIVLFIATSAFLSVVNSDRKTRATRIAADNLNIALEDMQRRIRTGFVYYCGGVGAGVADCPNGSSTLTFTEQDGITRTTYAWDNASKAIWRTTGAGVPVRTTSPEVSINGLTFVVQGSAVGPGQGGTDTTQPYVNMVIDGSIGSVTNPATRASFKIQTTVTQRNYDS